MHTVQYNLVSDVEKMTHAIAQLCHGTTVVDMLLLLYMYNIQKTVHLTTYLSYCMIVTHFNELAAYCGSDNFFYRIRLTLKLKPDPDPTSESELKIPV